MVESDSCCDEEEQNEKKDLLLVSCIGVDVLLKGALTNPPLMWYNMGVVWERKERHIK